MARTDLIFVFDDIDGQLMPIMKPSDDDDVHQTIHYYGHHQTRQNSIFVADDVKALVSSLNLKAHSQLDHAHCDSATTCVNHLTRLRLHRLERIAPFRHGP